MRKACADIPVEFGAGTYAKLRSSQNIMSSHILSNSQFASLQEIGKGLIHGPVADSDALRLLELNLIYKLLGSLRITTAGRDRIASGI